MRSARRLVFLVTLAVAATLVPTAAAQTVLFKDDAEGMIADNWLLNTPANAAIQPWQKSDSSATKFRMNQAHGGATSYWAGSQPQDFQPVDVVSGEATMQLKQPLLVPADGATTISLWSLFQNEGDDKGLVEAALDVGGKPDWQKVAAVKLLPAAAGDVMFTPGYCDPTHPDGTLTQGFDELKGDLAAFAGQKILLRINMKYGAENRSATQPCGWYVDDIAITTTGTPGLAGAPPASPPVGLPTAPTGRPIVKFGATKVRGRRATLSVTVSGSELRKVTVTLLKGKRKVATARIAQLGTGARKIVFKLRQKLRKGAYSVKLAGTYADGAAFTTSGKTKAR
jgi:hypothetical protein